MCAAVAAVSEGTAIDAAGRVAPRRYDHAAVGAVGINRCSRYIDRVRTEIHGMGGLIVRGLVLSLIHI